MHKRIVILSIVLLTVLSTVFFLKHTNTFSSTERIIIGDGHNGPKGMVWLPGGDFLMGSNSRLAHDNEKPAHQVHVDGFWIDRTDVTNREFAAFVKATGYVTTAERKPDWETIKAQLPDGVEKPSDDKLFPGAMVFIGTNHPDPMQDAYQWWRFIPGTDWRHPAGPNSNIIGKEDHPVVQVSYEDALAYAQWVGKRLPTEAEWEYAARGGLEQTDYSWGNEFKPNGKKMANTFAGEHFPVVTAQYRNKIGTTKVASFPPNQYGLYDMAGNVWQWVADWYRSDAFTLAANGSISHNPKGPNNSYDLDDPYTRPDAPKRVIRGGSFLCDENVCMSYRPSARRGLDPYNPMAHVGFRLVKSK